MEHHIPRLIQDLGLMLLVAAFVVLIFKKIKQPLVLGYIIAGFLVGPNFQLFPTVVESSNVKTLADIGVIFLLFGLGLEFSFKKLVNIGGSASITAFTEIIFISIGGYTTGRLLGWSSMDSLFLGGMLASSSTTIIIRAFDELGLKTQKFAQTVFGVLVVEDIVVILLMVLLSTIAATNQIEGGEILFTILKLFFFLVLWFVVGILIIPSLLKRNKKIIDDELLLMISVGLCLGMVLFATSVGFSAELGAFVMGSIIAETVFAEKVEHILKPVKDLFGAVFFISVGMMINPQYLIDYAGPIFWITLLTLFGKAFSSCLGALISGQPLKHSVQVGMSMAQIGEFAFIVATLGLSLGVISKFIFPIAVGVTAVTTFTTPYLIKASEPFYNWLQNILPDSWLNILNKYASETEQLRGESNWRKVIKSLIKIMIINSTVLIAIVILFAKYLSQYIDQQIDGPALRLTVKALLLIFMMFPFLWALIAKKPYPEGYDLLLKQTKNKFSFFFVISLLRLFAGALLLLFMFNRLGFSSESFLIILPLTIGFMYFYSKKIQSLYSRMEERFILNLNDRQITAEKSISPSIKKTKRLTQELAAWDIHIVELDVPALSAHIGKSLQDLSWRETYGVNIGYIKRGDYVLHVPDRFQKLYPYDKIGLIATDDQIKKFKPVFDALQVENKDIQNPSNQDDREDIKVNILTLDPSSTLCGKQLKVSGIRENTDGLVVAIYRNEKRILNPESREVLQAGDTVWIVGNQKKIEEFRVKCDS